MPATPMATSVRPSRQGRPKLSVMMTGMESLQASLQLAMQYLRRTRSGSFGQQQRVLAAVDVGNIHAAVGADEAVASFGDQDSVFATDHSLAFLREQLRHARIQIVAARPGARLAEGLILPSATSRPSAFETILCFTIRMSPSAMIVRMLQSLNEFSAMSRQVGFRRETGMMRSSVIGRSRHASEHSELSFSDDATG